MNQNRHVRLMSVQFGLVLLMGTCFGFSWSCYLILPKFLATQLGLHADQIGQIMAFEGVAGVCVTPIIGRLLDSHGRRPFVLLGNLFLVVSGLVFCFGHKFDLFLYTGQFLWGTGMVMGYNSIATWATDFSPPERLAQTIGLFGGTNIAMNAVAPLAGELISERYGWAPVFLISSLLAAVAFALTFLIRDAKPKGGGKQLNGVRKSNSILGWRMIEVYGAMFLMSASYIGLFVFYQPYSFQYGVTQVNTFFVGFASFAIGIRIFGGIMFDRLGPLRSGIVSLALYAVVPTALVMLGPQHLFLVGSMMGIAHGMSYPALMALGLLRTEVGSRGMVLSIINGSFSGGQALFAYVFGLLVYRTDFDFTFQIASVLTICAPLMLLLTYVITKLRMFSEPRSSHGGVGA